MDPSRYSMQGTYGYVTLNIATDKLVYTLNNNDPDTQALAAGQQVTDGFDITVQDGQGNSTTRHVDFTITGTNDAPEVEGNKVVAFADTTANPINLQIATPTDPDSPNLMITATAISNSAFGTIVLANGDPVAPGRAAHARRSRRPKAPCRRRRSRGATARLSLIRSTMAKEASPPRRLRSTRFRPRRR